MSKIPLPAPSAEPKHNANPSSEKKTILLVEDDADHRIMLRLIIEQFGLIALEARDGCEALEVASGQPPDLILLDLRLPGIDGIETIRRMRSLPALHRVPIVAMTAYPELRREAYTAGANDVLRKPLQLPEVQVFLRWFFSED
ncbi:MAG: response regulator [Acidobacteria bacterium]|nr:response regulator [Acidobacteriota bacterium]